MNQTVTPRGIRNNNPLNIRVGNNWKGEVSKNTDGAFEQFETMAFGMRAGLKLLRNYISGWNGTRPKCNCIADIVRKWAPPSENATGQYIDTVVRVSGILAHEKIYPNNRVKICKIARAMAFVECGVDTSYSDWLSAYDLI